MRGVYSAFDPVNEPGEDHPRMRGVYVSLTRAPKSSDGSSPHARGLQGDSVRFQ